MDAQHSTIRTIDDTSPKDWVAIVLAVGLVISFNLLIVTMLLNQISRGTTESFALSENATQVISGVFTGIIGVLGAYLGFKASARQHSQRVGTNAPSTTEITHSEVITPGIKETHQEEGNGSEADGYSVHIEED